MLFLLAAVLVFNGCGERFDPHKADSPSRNTPGGAIVAASIADARILIPILASDSASSNVCGLIYNGLVKYDKDLILKGDLAESWEIEEDGRRIIFHLRRGVKWHDGMPFTAADVEFTYQKLIDPQVRTPYSSDFERVEKFEVIDDFTVSVTYPESFVPALASWGMGVMPKHLLASEDLNQISFSRAPIGTGPYMFRRWNTQEIIELIANPEYFEGPPKLKRYFFRVIPDPATMFLELQNLGIDYMGLSSLQYQRQTDNDFFRDNFRKFRYQGFNYTYLGYNLRRPLFQDQRIRQAINYAVDKQEIISGVLLGLGSQCTGPFAPRSWAYNQEVKPVPYDPERAGLLFSKAGWTKNREGWLEKDGKEFEFTIITNQGNEDRKRAAEIIQKRLADVGVRVKIKVIEWSAFISEFVDKHKFDAVLLGWSLTPDPDVYDIWHSSKTGQGQLNFMGFNNPEVDELLIQGRMVFDQEERRKIYNRIHEIIYEEQPCLFLFTADSLPILHNRFQGIKVAPAGIEHNIIEWWVPGERQRYRF